LLIIIIIMIIIYVCDRFFLSFLLDQKTDKTHHSERETRRRAQTTRALSRLFSLFNEKK